MSVSSFELRSFRFCALFSFAAASLSACSLVTDFDASKLAAGGTGGGARTLDAGSMAGFPATGGGNGGVSSGVSGAGGSSPQDNGGAGFGTSSGGASTGGFGGDDASPEPACVVATNAGCAPDELCCVLGNGVTCRKTSTKECEQCGLACPAGLTTTCAARTCVCQTDAKRPCSGKGDELFCASGPPAACVECRDASDCAGRTDGKKRCAAGRCAVCDPTQTNAGCAGNTPICDAATHMCKACTVSPDDCPKPLVCTTAGACGSCGKSADCTSATSPICDATTTLCRPCASNAECSSGPKLPYCIERTCSGCNPSTESGCTDPTKPDCRGDTTGRFTCQGCKNDGNCANLPRTPVCDTATGRCVACALDDDCTATSKTPFCMNNACAACDTSTPIALVADLRCALKAGGQPACVSTGTQKGQCGACDPGGSRGCTNAQLCCENAGVAACVATSVTKCAACSASACDPLLANGCTNRVCGCGSGAACSGTGAARFCVGTSCGECRNNADCSGTLDRCSVSTHKCVDCDSTGGCADVPAHPICAANSCRACATDAECASAIGAAGPICAANGVCIPDSPCANNGDCTDGAHRVCAGRGADGGGTGHCRVCDPATGAGCAGAAKCNSAFVCTG